MKHLFSLSLLLVSISMFPQSKGDNKSTATILNNITGWCSTNGEFNTVEFEIEQPVGSCSGNAHLFGKWFKFKANTPNIEVILKTGGEYGTLQLPYVYIFDDKLNELACKKYLETTDFILLTANDLAKDGWYYIVINNHNHPKYLGTFSLCLNDKLSYDSKEGAVLIERTDKWCTSDPTFSTIGGTPNEPKGTCLPNGPNFDRWFKFTAKTKEIKITARLTDIEGSFQFPYITLFDEAMKELSCVKYSDEFYEKDIFLSHKGLILGKTYYLSIDHQLNPKYQGTFQLCFDDGTVKKTNTLFGKVKSSNKAGQKVKLYNKQNKLIDERITDRRGQFSFDYLPNTESYIIQLENIDPSAEVDMFLLDDKNEILKKALKVGPGKFELDELPKGCNNIGIVSCDNHGFKPAQGKRGIVGKIVKKSNPVDGISGINIDLYNHGKAKVGSALTDAEGNFQLNNLDTSKSYFVKIGSKEPNLYAEMLYVNDKGKALKSTSSLGGIDEDGFFHFEYLPMVKTTLDELDVEDIKLTDFSDLTNGKTIVMENLYFQQSSDKLMLDSFYELGSLIDYLKTNKIKVEVIGHTDNVGADEINLHLSKARAKTIVDYLIKAGIEASRLSYKGEGKNSPIAENGTEEGRNRNRRVEVRIF
jgi:outer membrane protein OmpA-like peptidoglycan-associated protein